jgi:hypothetical protein
VLLAFRIQEPGQICRAGQKPLLRGVLRFTLAPCRCVARDVPRSLDPPDKGQAEPETAQDKIIEEIGLDDGAAALQQLGFLKAA